jgi:hypothetical protein
MADSQTDDGLVPDIAPEYVVFQDGFRDSTEWGSACVIVPWQQYQFTGNPNLLIQSYPVMKRYVDYLGNKSSGYILDFGLGDWYDIGPISPGYSQLTPVSLTATAFYYNDVKILSYAAKLCGHLDDYQKYLQLSNYIRDAFNNKFFDQTTQNYSTGSDTANALPWVMGIIPETMRNKVAANVADYIISHDNSFTAGDVGYRYVLLALADSGRSDLIYKMNNLGWIAKIVDESFHAWTVKRMVLCESGWYSN